MSMEKLNYQQINIYCLRLLPPLSNSFTPMMGTHQQYYNGRRPPFHGGFVLEFFQTALSKPGIKVYQFGPANQATPCSLLQFPPFSFPDQSSSPRLVIPPNAAAPSLMSSN